MNKEYTWIFFIASFIIAVLFFGTVYSVIGVKQLSKAVDIKYNEIEKLRTENKRISIEASVFSNPLDTLDYINKENFLPVPLKNIKIIEIKKTK